MNELTPTQECTVKRYVDWISQLSIEVQEEIVLGCARQLGDAYFLRKTAAAEIDFKMLGKVIDTVFAPGNTVTVTDVPSPPPWEPFDHWVGIDDGAGTVNMVHIDQAIPYALVDTPTKEA